MTTTQTYTGTLIVIGCARCSMDFGVTKRFDEDRRDNHKSFYCPQGHTNYYPQKSETEKLREEIERKERQVGRLTSSRDQASARADHEAARANGYKGALVKTKKRIGKGVCPNCNRHFADVERHMATKHPEVP